MCRAFADARMTQNPDVINAVAVDIEHVRLPKLFPDKPTLAQILHEQTKA